MYRIYDFHSNKAPKLKNQQKFSPFFAQDSDDEEDTEYGVNEQIAPDPNEYEKFFKLVVGCENRISYFFYYINKSI